MSQLTYRIGNNTRCLDKCPYGIKPTELPNPRVAMIGSGYCICICKYGPKLDTDISDNRPGTYTTLCNHPLPPIKYPNELNIVGFI